MAVLQKISLRHYAWVILIVTALTLLTASGVRNIPGVIIKPLETDFGWDRTSISFAVMVSLFAFGFGAPLAGSLIDRFGPRRIILGSLALTAAGLAPLLVMTQLWQLHLLWGLIVGIGTGAVSGVLGATVAQRWFNKQRGFVLGLFSAATATGQLLFVPSMIWLNSMGGWRLAVGVVTIIVALVLIPVVFFMRNRPQDIGAEPYGGAVQPTPSQQADDERVTTLAQAVRTRDFWLLAGSFFICGYTTNGLIGTHLLPHTLEHGFTEVASAGAIGLMGIMNVFGALSSGWLSDRYDNRKLLAAYYGFRGISLAALPFIIEYRELLIFAVIYGLDWVATVPPTINLTAARFGKKSVGTLYGWIFCSHMIGAGIAAQAGGFFRDQLGDYHLIFISAALMGIIASTLSLRITRQKTAAELRPAGAAAGD
ncbi:MAG: MFS transporter [Anaerolineae bacterium]